MPGKLPIAEPLAADESSSTRAVPKPRRRPVVMTPAERTAAGKAARRVVPRTTLGGWTVSADRPDPVEVLTDQASGRLPDLVPIRNGRMLVSPFAFYRGGAAVMAADLAATPSSGIRVQLCGDAHLSNFGGYASPDRSMVFDLNDFDETIPGPWEWDVKRLVASLEIAGRDKGLARSERRSIVKGTARSYRQGMRQFAAMTNMDLWYSRMDADAVHERWSGDVSAADARAFQRRVRKAMGKDSLSAAAKLTQLVDGERRMISDPPLIVPLVDLLDEEQRLALERTVKGALRAYSRTLSGDRRHLLEQFTYVDMARKVVGVGSVGTRSWIVLLRGLHSDDLLMLQMKEARESVLAPYAGASRYSNQGQRVVEGQRLMQASSDIFLGWHRGPGIDGTDRDFYIRQLWDWKLSGDPAQASLETLAVNGQLCGWTLARAHARSGDRVALAAYLGSGAAFDDAMTGFAETYADQNERDYTAFADAAKAGRMEFQMGL